MHSCSSAPQRTTDIYLTQTCMISVLAERQPRRNVKQNHRLVHASGADLGVVPGPLSVQHLVSMASVGLEEQPPVRVPQLHRLVTAASQAVAAVSWKKGKEWSRYIK